MGMYELAENIIGCKYRMNRYSSNVSDPKPVWGNTKKNTNKNTNKNKNTNTENSDKENPYNNIYQVNTNAMVKSTPVGDNTNSPPSLKNYWNYYLPALKGQSSAPITPPGKPFGKLPFGVPTGGRRTRKKSKSKSKSRKQKNRK